MRFLQDNLLTLLIVMPTVGACFTLLAKGRDAARWSALTTTLITLALALLILVPFKWRPDAGTTAAYGYNGAAGPAGSFGVVQLVREADWIPTFNIKYRVGVDGLSLPLVLLTAFICVLSAVASWDLQRMSRGYFALLLFLETGLLGTFLSLDFFLFYVFFEITLLPMYFLIGIWGGERKEYAAIKFFLYTLVGSIALLVVLIGTYLVTKDPAGGKGSFDLVRLPALVKAAVAGGGLTANVAGWFFVLAMVGFLVKLPAVPLHTWLPDAHVEAPTPISMILAAILLKMGGYGIFRVAYPLFPDAARELWMPFAVVGVASIIYGGLCAMAQTDFKRLVAYSSVSHMGFVTLGAAMMTKTAANGALFMMVAHGITSAMLFFVVGVVYDRARHREIARFGGLATTMPLYTGLSTVGMMANLGLPGLCGFVGEILVLLGSFEAARPDSILMQWGRARGVDLHVPIYTFAILACTGIVISAAYMLWTIQRVYFGPERPEYRNFPEVDAREQIVLWPLAAMAVLLGVLPTMLVFTFTESTMDSLFKLLALK
jgi:NADH-quinone oxidoreductase subunit M